MVIAQQPSSAPPPNTYNKDVAKIFAGTIPQQQGPSTHMDLPADFHHYYGQQVNQYKDIERKIAKLDLDMDLNYDGYIDNLDPADQGAFESTPPGAMIAAGEMTKALIRLTPYRVDYDGEVVVTFEIAGINRAVSSGEFQSFQEEQASVGHVRVWRDPQRRQLLLDSADPNKRYVEFLPDFHTYPYNLPTVVPRCIYVEGVSVSPRFLGDLRLLVTCTHRAPGSNREGFSESRKRLFRAFRTSFDHILLTIVKEPVRKEFINNNAEGVWWHTDSSGVMRLEKDSIAPSGK